MKPFSNSFVLSETMKHLQRAVEISINKTLSRLPEFEGDSEKGKEILTALGNLAALQKLLISIKEENKELFK